MPVASARPAAVKTACHGRRSILRRAMRNTGLNKFVRPMRSNSEGLKSAGGSGRIASAGGSFTACRTAPITPRAAAPALTSRADAERAIVHAENQRGEAEEQVVHVHDSPPPMQPPAMPPITVPRTHDDDARTSDSARRPATRNSRTP